jgi:hypothetical protein
MRQLDPEKNDVNVMRLFDWGKKFNIVDTNGNLLSSVYIKLVGDADLNRARVYSLRKSAELRKKLKDVSTDERMAYIADKESVSKEWLVSYVLLSKTRNLSSEALKNIYVKYPKEPIPDEKTGDVPLEEQEKYQLEIDDFDKKLSAEAKKYITKQVNFIQKDLETKDFDTLYSMYTDLVINALCEEEGYFKFREMCLFFGSYKDAKYKIHFFNDIKEVEDLLPELKAQFIEHYLSLELTTEELKK